MARFESVFVPDLRGNFFHLFLSETLPAILGWKDSAVFVLSISLFSLSSPPTLFPVRARALTAPTALHWPLGKLAEFAELLSVPLPSNSQDSRSRAVIWISTTENCRPPLE